MLSLFRTIFVSLFLACVAYALILFVVRQREAAQLAVCRDELRSMPGAIASESAASNARSIEAGTVRVLAHYDPLYDDERNMVRVKFRSPGYHSQVETGSSVHPTRDSLIYALALLQRDAVGDRLRASLIIHAVLKLQNSITDSPTFGVWPWLLEEPLSQMDPPDSNWADFCGAHLVHMLIAHPNQLPAELVTEMRASVRRAAKSIRRRNVGPAYSNIAVLGGGVCAAAGELLADDGLLEYGRLRLAGVVAHVDHHGSFAEYNSPPCLNVVIGECERTLQLVRAEATLRAAESLRRTAWQIVSESFHPATQQWAGPHALSSRDRLRRNTAEFLARRVGVEIATHPTMESEETHGYELVRPIPCPAEFASRFVTAADADINAVPYELQRTFQKGRTEATTVVGTTWFGPDACLGSVNQSSLWTQRKPVIGYWRTNEDPAIVFRVRLLHDGRDFASMGLNTMQKDRRILADLNPLGDKGDWHLRLDRPKDGQFIASNFWLRLELSGTGVKVERLEENRYSLAAGDYRIVIHPTPSQFAGLEVRWELGENEDQRFVDGVCYHGPEKSFDWNSTTIQLPIGLELLKTSEQPTASVPNWQETTEGQRVVFWDLPESNTQLQVRPEHKP